MKRWFDNQIYKYVMRNRKLRSRITRDTVNRSLDEMIREKRKKYKCKGAVEG